MAQEIVIVAITGRALAQSAAKTGCRVRVFDAFADRDTQAAAETVCVAADGAIALDHEKLLSALSGLAETGEGRVIVPGSGFERTPQWPERLARCGTLCANDADIVAALKEPELATELLRALGWRVPETRREPPADPRGWLHKEIGGAGGVHVRRAETATAHARAYYQREMPGRPLSVTFLADAERSWVLGFNALAVQAMGDAPFCYAGASTCAFDPVLEREVQARLDRLVRVTGLRGLNGLDFLLDGGEMYALEVNPRPTATFELYDPDYAEGLVYWHIRSFAGPLGDFPARRIRSPAHGRGCAVVYAQHAFRVPAGAELPGWCRDLPVAGGRIQAGAPVLTVFAEARDETRVQHLLRERQHEIRGMLQGWRVDLPKASAA